MLKVKIINGQADVVEQETNNFLMRIGSRPGIRIDLRDIKFVTNGMNVATMVIYNELAAAPVSPGIPSQKKPAPIPGTPDSFK